MKWLAVVMSMYMMLLSGIPCADAVVIEPASKTSITATSTETKGHSPATDLCSPLCICSCCAGFALQTISYKASLISFTKVIPAPLYRTVALRQPSFSIWQPPKL